MTLEQALKIAVETSESVAAARAGVRRAEAEQARARSGRFPQLSGSVSYDRALASEFSGVFDRGGGPPCDPFRLDPSAPLDARVAEIERAIDCGAIGNAVFGGGGDAENGTDLPFGRENTWRFGLSLSQSVFSGGRLDALDALAAAGREGADLTMTSTRAQLLFDVTQAYYDAALSDRLVAIAEGTVNQAEATVRQVQASFEAGAQPEFELLRARVARDNETPALIRQRANRDVALLRLKQMLDMPHDAPLQLADALTDPVLAPPAPFAAALASVNAIAPQPEPARAAADLAAVNERTAVREVAAIVRQREASLSAARAERMPTLTVNSSFAQVAYPAGVFPTSDFRTNWTIGAAVQMPLLTGGRLRAEERIAQADVDQSRAELQQTSELAALDTRSAWAELLAAQAVWEASAGTVQQATRAYEIADVRYRAGVSTQLELSDSRLLLQQSEANRAQAARDLQVARARLALLPELPLGSTGTQRPAPQQTSPRTTPAPDQTTPASPLRTTTAATSTQGGRQ